MSEVHRYNVVTMLSEAGSTIGYDPHGPEVVMASEFNRVTAERDALQERLNAADQCIDELTSKPGPDTPVCRGSTALGTACGKCARCLAPPGEVKFKGMIETACGTFAVMINEANAHYGWTFQRHPDGMWVSGRKATEAEMNAARANAKIIGQL